MNWDDLERGGMTAEVLRHWRRLGQFRRAHPAVGLGEHRRLQDTPYIFSRTLETDEVSDRVIVAIDVGEGTKTIPVFDMFPDGTELTDSYSGVTGTVTNGEVTLNTPFGLLLLSERRW